MFIIAICINKQLYFFGPPCIPIHADGINYKRIVGLSYYDTC